ncbi:PPE family protein [Mycobacterium botniense]|uniref:PPE family protein n=1 Tax=Mycobacterium botniense TaxID=84962 RepID=A0A7I9XYM0_9MYCO|nr:PPE family protein [Mycobacterium botniense]GFG74904.1 hypothetical protein MBOT_22690 [Mycobacterium botniense]
MDFGALPPEINSARMYAGPGVEPMLAAAAAWDDLAAGLYSAAVSSRSVITALVDRTWQGAAASTMAAAAAPYVSWITATAAHCEQVANHARAAASAFETAFAMTVPPPVVAANRAQLTALVATNILGQNAPAIAVTEAQYGEMWAQDAAAMYGYASNSAAAATLPPFTSPQPAAHRSGLAGQAVAVAGAAGAATGTRTHTAIPAVSAIPRALQGLSSPAAPTAGLSQSLVSSGASCAGYAPAGVLPGLTGASGKSALKSAGKGAAAGAALSSPLAAASSGQSIGLAEDTAGFGMDAAGFAGLDGGGVGLDTIGVGLELLGADELTESGGLGPLGVVPPGVGGGVGLAPLGGLGAAAAHMGQAGSLGIMSVPQGWGELLSAATMGPASAMPLPPGGLGAVSAAAAGKSSIPTMSIPGLAGREVVGGVPQIGFRPRVIGHSVSTG